MVYKASPDFKDLPVNRVPRVNKVLLVNKEQPVSKV